MYYSSDPHEFPTIQTVLAQMPGVVYQLKQGRPHSRPVLSYISDNCQRIFGLCQAKMHAETTLFWDCLHPSDRATLQVMLDESRQALRCCLWTGRIIQPSGAIQWVQTTAQPSYDGQQTLIWNGLLSIVLPNSGDSAPQKQFGPLISPPQAQRLSHQGSFPTSDAYFDPHDPSHSAVSTKETGIGQANKVLEHEVAERTSQLNQTIELLLDEVVERSHAEKALRDRDAFLHSIYNNVHQAIFVVDIDEAGAIRFAEINPACEVAFGIKSLLAQGQTPEEILGDRAGFLFRQQYQQCINQGVPVVYEESMQLQSGPVWWLTQLTPLKHKDGTVYRIIGNAIDITHQKQVEKALKRRDRFLQGAAMANRHLLTQPNLLQAVQSALAALGAATGVHHIYILERVPCSEVEVEVEANVDTKTESAPDFDMEGDSPLIKPGEMHLFCEWGNRGSLIHPTLETHSGMDVIQGQRDWHNSLAMGDAIMGSVDLFSASIRHYLEHYGVCSVLVEPIMMDQEFWGCIVFEDCTSEDEWPASERSIFRTVAENMAGAIARHYIEAELMESTQLLQVVMDNIPQAVFWKDCESVYLGCNVTFAEATGMEHTDDIIGKTDYDLSWTTKQAEMYQQNDQYVMNTDTPLYHVIESQLQIDGAEILCDVNKIPLHDQDGQVVGVLGTFEDITERQKAEDALRESEAKLRQQTEELQATLQELQQTQSQLIQSEKMSSLGQLVAGVAHEINNPVNFIYGNLNHAREYAAALLRFIELTERHGADLPLDIQTEVDTLDVDFLKEDFPKLLDSMKVGAVRIRKIVSSLRTFSRMDEAEQKVVNVHEGIDSTLMILQGRLKQSPKLPNGISVQRHYGTIPAIECFAGPLNQVFMNLLSNAIDALEDAVEFYQEQQVDFQPCLTISTAVFIPLEPGLSSLTQDRQNIDGFDGSASPSPQSSSDHFLKVAITDNACGIPEDIQSRLFDPFFTTKPVGRGTGMGLSISYQIVTERHGGTLDCVSAQGKGTTFTLKIPLKGTT